jgi:hypothetical protein
VVLLLGDLQGGTTADNVPAAARKALVDMRDFLPYKSYRLLDTGWTLASNNSVRSTLRLRGLENQEFELNLGGAAPPAGPLARLNLSFMLSEGGPDGVAPGYAELTSRNRMTELRQAVTDLESRLARFDSESAVAEKQLERVTDPAERRDAQTRRREERVAMLQQLGTARERLKQMQNEQIGASRVQQDLETRKLQLADLEARRKVLEDSLQSLKRNDTSHPQIIQLQAELDRLSVQVAAAREGARPAFAPGRRIIDTSFSMDVGETVVVGTSRLGGGDKAIIALLTAVARAR